MRVLIEFIIDDDMAQNCVDFLLATGQKVTKKAIIEKCRSALYSTGDGFQQEPSFDDWDIEEVVTKDEAFYENSISVFNKIWKK